MYTNIDTDHGVNILNSFQKCTEMNCQLASLLLAYYQRQLILMRFNVVEFGDTIIRQIMGMAMGTPSAYTYARMQQYTMLTRNLKSQRSSANIDGISSHNKTGTQKILT